jgi:type IV pilus biogenesis protein CpaD/CtpE
MANPSPSPLVPAFSLVGIAVVFLSGCTSTRMDSVTAAAGDALYHNRVVHAVDPWPSYAWDTELEFDGQRTARVIEVYRSGSQQAADGETPPPDEG